MIYIHKDVIYDFKIYNYIKNILDKKRVPSKLIDAHDFDLVNSLDVKNDDVLIAMFKHDKEDLAMTKKVFPILSKKFKTMYPSPESYYYYEDKWKQYEFMVENDIPCLETHYVTCKEDIEKLNINFPIVTKKTWGAGAEQINYFETLDSVVDDETTRSWTQDSIYPCLVQEYEDTDCDLRLSICGDKVFYYKRMHLWKTGNKDNFPYGMPKTPRERVLKFREPPFKPPNQKNIDEEEIYNLHDLIVKFHDLQKTKLNTYYMSWDIVNGKVLEFSVTATLNHPHHYYDINKKKTIKPSNNEFGTLEYLVNEYIK